MRIVLGSGNLADYRLFLAIKKLPRYRFEGHTAIVPDEYADRLGLAPTPPTVGTYRPLPCLFDYQRDVAALAIRKRKFAVFARCGLGKSLILLEWARHVQRMIGPTRRVLIVSPLMVVRQMISEARRFYGDHPEFTLSQVKAKDLARWVTTMGDDIGITNYEALTPDIPQGRLGALGLDEASLLKSHYGKWGSECIRLGSGLDWKLALTGTPAPNDRIEFANHAVFLDAFPTVNSFLSRFFVNRGQTDNRWELKPHALAPFYRSLSHWCIFLNNPATYGWRDNAGTIPPVHVQVHHVEMTDQQLTLAREATGSLFANELGGITGRSQLGQLAKGRYNGQQVDTAKPGFIRDLVARWPDRSTIIWCIYNHEQDALERIMPDAVSLRGDTPYEDRERLIGQFLSGERRVIISKSKVMGFGLNLQIATRMVFSGLQDSWETYHQCIARANRVGSTEPLEVHIPATDLEIPMLETVFRKAQRIDEDTAEQERLFSEIGFGKEIIHACS